MDLKVSVITTRRAYADLEAAGVVVRHQGRGTFVALLTSPHSSTSALMSFSASSPATTPPGTRPSWTICTRLRLLLGLAFRPTVLLLDEPASGPDLSARRTLMELVLERGEVVTSGRADALIGDEHTLEEALLAWRAA